VKTILFLNQKHGFMTITAGFVLNIGLCGGQWSYCYYNITTIVKQQQEQVAYVHSERRHCSVEPFLSVPKC
jgi:hypothetical protein